MKKLFIGMAIGCSLLLATPLLAASDADIYLDGAKEETKAVIQDGRTLLPIRSISNMLDAPIDYNATTKKITAGYDSYTFTIGSTNVTKSGQSVEALDVPPFVDQGVAYLPIRYVADIFGAGIEWHGDVRQVAIASPYKIYFDNQQLHSPTLMRDNQVLWWVKSWIILILTGNIMPTPKLSP